MADYVSAAFLDPDTAPQERFPGFTPGATRLARATGAVLSRADLDPDTATGGAPTIEVVSVEAPVNVLAPGGRPAGATARLELVLALTPPPRGAADESATPEETGTLEEAGEPEVVRLRGRLLLTPVGEDWQIFGFDVTRTDR